MSYKKCVSTFDCIVHYIWHILYSIYNDIIHKMNLLRIYYIIIILIFIISGSLGLEMKHTFFLRPVFIYFQPTRYIRYIYIYIPRVINNITHNIFYNDIINCNLFHSMKHLSIYVSHLLSLPIILHKNLKIPPSPFSPIKIK